MQTQKAGGKTALRVLQYIAREAQCSGVKRA